MLAIPDDQGGHRVIVRPDTYVEANLYPSHKGAKDSYNLIAGDFDGRLGSGATGWVIIDSGCPDVVVRVDTEAGGGYPPFKVLDSGGPEPGLKSIDWWGPWRCTPDFSGVIWDRWIFRHLYATGSEGGMGWDMTCALGAEFTVIGVSGSYRSSARMLPTSSWRTPSANRQAPSSSTGAIPNTTRLDSTPTALAQLTI